MVFHCCVRERSLCLGLLRQMSFCNSSIILQCTSSGDIHSLEKRQVSNLFLLPFQMLKRISQQRELVFHWYILAIGYKYRFFLLRFLLFVYLIEAKSLERCLTRCKGALEYHIYLEGANSGCDTVVVNERLQSALDTEKSKCVLTSLMSSKHLTGHSQHLPGNHNGKIVDSHDQEGLRHPAICTAQTDAVDCFAARPCLLVSMRSSCSRPWCLSHRTVMLVQIKMHFLHSMCLLSK